MGYYVSIITKVEKYNTMQIIKKYIIKYQDLKFNKVQLIPKIRIFKKNG